ncbi:MAG: histidinol-phosphatase HisJ family protein [Clostridiales bacterium]|nr:histidinol-phosphatase HisJ family protein [Clostridiales bacterium]
MFDYHIHSKFSVDAKMSMDEACERAINLGVKEIVFTDHIDMDWPDDDRHFAIENIEEYILDIERVQRRYKDSLIVKKGMELGYQPHLIDELNLRVKRFPVDFIISSIHVIDGLDPYKQTYYEGKTKKESYERYYEEILHMIQNFDNFDVVGHIDYVKRYSPIPWEKGEHLYGMDILDEIFKLLIEKGKGIEVNTSGYRHVSNTPMPDMEIVKRFHSMGGEIITIGSDAHSVEGVAYLFERALKELKDIGVDKLCLFTNRRPDFVYI